MYRKALVLTAAAALVAPVALMLRWFEQSPTGAPIRAAPPDRSASVGPRRAARLEAARQPAQRRRDRRWPLVPRLPRVAAMENESHDAYQAPTIGTDGDSAHAVESRLQAQDKTHLDALNATDAERAAVKAAYDTMLDSMPGSTMEEARANYMKLWKDIAGVLGTDRMLMLYEMRTRSANDFVGTMNSRLMVNRANPDRPDEP